MKRNATTFNGGSDHYHRMHKLRQANKRSAMIKNVFDVGFKLAIFAVVILIIVAVKNEAINCLP